MGLNVFIADDHGIIRDGLRLLLETQPGIKVVGDAQDGREAVKQVQKLQPDIVIMDISMPLLNGIEATQQICQTCPETRVLILSIYSTPEHIFRALQAGAKGYLLKESAGKELVAAVFAIHNGGRYLSHKISETVIDDYMSQKGGHQTQAPLERLSSREREILQLVAEGKSSTEIAQILFISPKTVETYRSRLMQKIGVTDLPGLVKFAIQHGLSSLE